MAEGVLEAIDTERGKEDEGGEKEAVGVGGLPL
jgi:hypothetical protein